MAEGVEFFEKNRGFCPSRHLIGGGGRISREKCRFMVFSAIIWGKLVCFDPRRFFYRFKPALSAYDLAALLQAVGSFSGVFDEPFHLLRVLVTGTTFDPAGDIHSIRTDNAHCLSDVFRSQTSRQDQRYFKPKIGKQFPRRGFTGASELAGHA